MFNSDDKENEDRKLNRRDFMRKAGVLGLAGIAGGQALKAVAHPLNNDTPRVITAPDQPNPPVITQEFPIPGNDERQIVQYPEKRPLIRITSRPPQLETPMPMLAEKGGITANDAFFVRYHNSEIPLSIDPKTYTVEVKVNNGVYDPLTSTPTTIYTVSLDDLRTNFHRFSIAAVNQCSGNSRGLESPRMPGGQIGNGACGCAIWTGVRLKDVLEAAGVPAGTQQVIVNGLDQPDDEPPDFVKAIPLDRAMDGEVMLAYAMNGEEIPMLNGYPLKLIVPGWYGTYHVKHINEIILSDSSDFSKMFYMGTAYRIPDNGSGYLPPGTAWSGPWIPITRIRIRSFITSHVNGATVHTGRPVKIHGVAFDGGDGIKTVEFSSDGGASWKKAELGRRLGNYAFREWRGRFVPPADGEYTLKVRAVSNSGETQPENPDDCWNPNGYMRNVVESVRVTAVSDWDKQKGVNS